MKTFHWNKNKLSDIEALHRWMKRYLAQKAPYEATKEGFRQCLLTVKGVTVAVFPDWSVNLGQDRQEYEEILEECADKNHDFFFVKVLPLEEQESYLNPDKVPYRERKLALSDDILLSVDKSVRYVGGEGNAVYKDKSKVKVRFCMCFPDVYEIGMSHLGIQILYDMFNSWEDVWCERVYSPWPDMDALMRKENIPLFAIESQDPIKEFDFLGITIQYEMCYTNILQILDLSGIPLWAKDRTEADPIVIGGGPCTYNPEPIAPFFDLFYIGEGETQYAGMMELYKQYQAEGKSRQEFLRACADIPGIYVPSLYQPSYNEDGTLASFDPICQGVPRRIRKEIELDMSCTYYPKKPLVPLMQVTQDRIVLEIQRGCIRGCRFCQAGQVYRPVRERSMEFLKEQAIAMMDSTGSDEITLSSLSSSDYTHLKEFVYYLIEETDKRHVNIALPSLRIDAFSLDVMSKIQDVKKSSITFAPEAGTQRMRDVINKGLTEEDILNGAAQAFKGGWNKVKLYFMLGQPTETDEDVRGIPELAEKIAEAYYEIPKDQRNGKCQITFSTSFFVPKPFTPFQWAPMCTSEEFLRKAYLAKDTMRQQKNQKSLRYHYHEAPVTILEGVLARGDRRIADAVYAAYQKGCIFDAWDEYFDNQKWMEAFEENHISLDFYNFRERSTDELLPWDFLDTGVTKNFLKKEWERAKQAEVTPNCKMQCNHCGAAVFGGGICYENKNEIQ